MMGVLERELRDLLVPYADEVKRTGMGRSGVERVDGYVRILRDVLGRSSLCYIDAKNMAFFNGKAYSRISRSSLMLVMENILLEVGVGASDAKKIGDMPFSIIFKKPYCGNPMKVCFANCVYDIGADRSYPFDRKYVTDYALPYEWDADARCPKWDAFLAEVLPVASERACLQEFFGLCFVDRSRCSIEKWAMLIGSGANGKSVIFDVMQSVIGKDYVSYFSPAQLMDNKQVVGVIGKKLNFSPDVKRSSAFDSGLKALASGQSVQGWQLYVGSVPVVCPPLVFAFNELPRFCDTTDAFFRRVMPFQFNVVIPPERQNRKLAAEICRTELPGIFNWVMEGRRRLLKRRGAFTHCDKIDWAVNMLRHRNGSGSFPVLSYLERIGYATCPQYDGQPYEKVPASRIHRGLGGVVSKDAITRELNSLGVAKDRGVEVRYFLYRLNVLK